ncbi:MAG: succinylglutamate desuccinylase/aspartoacylase family protein [Phycisphaeraceae bacterium]|nr:succinylglutamate desuccinylase/aspartoacylase family protein [Phycisphaeraceae bacterium]
MSSINLQSRVITGDRSGPHLLIVGGVHGDEFEPMVTVRRLIREIKPAQLRGRLTLIPVVNESAFWRGHRTAEDGLDLARTFPGRPDGSITQRTAHAATAFIRSADYFIDLHTGGTTMALWPLAGYGLVSDPKTLEAQRRMARAFNLPLVWGTTLHPGRSLSAASDANIPAIYSEWGGAATCLDDAVTGYIEGCLNVMAVLGMIDRTLPRNRVKHVIEDNRDQAGHLQVNNPSPMSGCFIPRVKLGDVVKKGQIYGTVSDILGDQVIDMPSPVDGLVILLRTFPMVKENETLAVIIELDQAEVLS